MKELTKEENRKRNIDEIIEENKVLLKQLSETKKKIYQTEWWREDDKKQKKG